MAPLPLLYETHLHTPLCNHAKGLPGEYAAAAAAHARGYKGIVVTCHNPDPGGLGNWQMTASDWPAYLAMVEDARREWDGRIDVRLGIECDYWPAVESALKTQIAAEPFDYVLGSVHPHTGNYRKLFWRDSVFAFQQTYFDHLAQAAESGLFDCLSHPDLVRVAHPHDWDRARIWPDVLRALDRIAATGVAMELNTSGMDKKHSEAMNPEPQILTAMCERSIPVVIGSDAHEPQRVGARIDLALDVLTAAGYTEISIFLKRTRQTIAIVDARESIGTPTAN